MGYRSSASVEDDLSGLIKALKYTLDFGINLHKVDQYLRRKGFNDFGKCISHLSEKELIQQTDVSIQEYFDLGEPLKENFEKMGRVAVGNVFTRLPYPGCARTAQGIISRDIRYNLLKGLYFPDSIVITNHEELKKFVQKYRTIEQRLRQLPLPV